MQTMMKVTHKFVVDQQIKNSEDFFNILPLGDEEQLESLEAQLRGDVNFKLSFVSLFFYIHFYELGAGSFHIDTKSVSKPSLESLRVRGSSSATIYSF